MLPDGGSGNGDQSHRHRRLIDEALLRLFGIIRKRDVRSFHGTSISPTGAVGADRHGQGKVGFLWPDQGRAGAMLVSIPIPIPVLVN